MSRDWRGGDRGGGGRDGGDRGPGSAPGKVARTDSLRRRLPTAETVQQALVRGYRCVAQAREALPTLAAAVDPAGRRDLEAAAAASYTVELALMQAEGCRKDASHNVAELGTPTTKEAASPDEDVRQPAEGLQGEVDALSDAIAVVRAEAQPLLARRPPNYRAAEDESAAGLFQDGDAIERLQAADARASGEWNATLDAHGAGAPLAPDLRGRLEATAGQSLESVRVRDDEEAHRFAASHEARAVTIGQTIHMGAGEDASTQEGQQLLAHETAHTVQQGATGQPRLAAKPLAATTPTEPAELEADEFADAAARGQTFAIGESLQVSAARKPRSAPNDVRQGAASAGPDGNAYLRVVAVRADGSAVSWSGMTVSDTDELQHYSAEKNGAQWSWEGDAPRVRVDTAAAGGRGGVSVTSWAEAQGAVRVTVVVEPQTLNVHDDGEDNTGLNIGEDDAAEEAVNGHAYNSVRREKRSETGQESAAENAAFERSLGIDDGFEEGTSEADFESALRETGSGGIGRDASGDASDSENLVEGNDDLDGNDRAEGEEGKGWYNSGSAGGAEQGGNANADTGGIREGLGFAVLFAVPAVLRPLVDLAMVIGEAYSYASAVGAFKGILKQSLKKGAKHETQDLAKLATQSRIEARKKFQQAIPKLRKSKPWAALSKQERAEAERVIYWSYQRQYFDEVEHAAQEEVAQLSMQLKKAKKKRSKDAAALATKLDHAKAIEGNLKVKPIAGRLPANYEWAGKQYPVDLLPAEFRDKPLVFTADGFPDFSPWAKVLPNGDRRVAISLKARKADIVAANAAAGFKTTPTGWIWHHHQEEGVMLLVPEELHHAVRHTGGVAHHKHRTGIEKYEN